MLLQDLEKKKIISPPYWLSDNCQYLVMSGSVCYGVSNDQSDADYHGFAIPSKDMIFPHLAGEIPGFGSPKELFAQWESHGNKDASTGKEYDFNIYNIVKFFQLLLEGNPNTIEYLYVPMNCIIHTTKIGQLVRDNRKMFLTKKSYHRFQNYTYSQCHKMASKNPQPESKRGKLREEYGLDTKFAYNIVRLADECDQILTTGDIDLQRAKEHMKAVRRGEVSLEEILSWLEVKKKTLEKLYAESTLPLLPDEEKIKALLCHCLEEHYGSLENCVAKPDWALSALREVQEILQKHRRQLS